GTERERRGPGAEARGAAADRAAASGGPARGESSEGRVRGDLLARAADAAHLDHRLREDPSPARVRRRPGVEGRVRPGDREASGSVAPAGAKLARRVASGRRTDQE